MFNYWLRSLSARLWLTSVTALAISLTVMATVLIYALNHFPPQFFRSRSDLEDARAVVAGLRFDARGRPNAIELGGQVAWPYEVLPTELMYRVLDSNGQIVLASRDAHEGGPWVNRDLATLLGKVTPATLSGKSFAVVTLAVRHAQTVFYVQTATSVNFDKAVLILKIGPIRGTVQATILIATIIFGLTLTFTVRRVLRPLRDASRDAALITPRNLAARLSTKGVPSELKPLINAFNEALERLERGYAVQQQFLASAAHELQTPLTLIRGQIELQPEIDDKDALYREIDLMARQVRQLLHLAEVSEVQNFTFSPVSSADVAKDVVAYLSRKAGQKQVALQIDMPQETAPISADKSALFILLKNILENAINATPPHGQVSIFIDDASIQIRDQGPGIHPDHLPFLFERFWRAPDATHDGAGIGLAICKEIALAHEWRLSVTPLSPGTQFGVWFQPAPAAPVAR